MALKGNLRDFTVAQLLNLINLAHKTGILVIEGAVEHMRIAFRQGKLIYAENGRVDNNLAGILLRDKKFSQSQYQIVKERGGTMKDTELGLMLINVGYITQQEIIASIQQYYVGIVRRSFGFADGAFHFENEAQPPEGKICVRIDLENLIMEGSRHLKEQEQLQDEIPTLDIALKFKERPGVSLHNVNLSEDEWRVVKYISPDNTIRQIARTLKLTDLEIRRVVFGLLQAGLVEPLRAPGGTSPIVRVLPNMTKDEQRSIFDRIITRIRSL